MSSPYLEETFHPFLETRGGRPAVTWVTEREPLGTGGAIVSVLDRLGVEPFLALNGDILTDLDLTAMLDRHRSASAAAHDRAPPRGGRARVRPRRDGPDRPRHRVPGEAAGSDPRGHQRRNVCPRPLRPPRLGPRDVPLDRGRDLPVADRRGRADASGSRSDAYWLDLGTPEQYLRAHVDLLAGRVAGHAYDAPWIGPGARVDPSARVGRSVAIGPGARVEAGGEVDGTVLLPGSVVEEGRAGRALGRSDPGRRLGRAHRSSDACSATVSGWAQV